MSRILIAVPTYENITPDTFKSIYELESGEHSLEFDFFRGYDVANARNLIGLATLERGFDYVLMVDNDEVLQKDTLLNLMEDLESEPEPTMVVGFCLSRPTGAVNTSGKTTVFRFNKRDYTVEDAYTCKELRDLLDKGLVKLQIRGSGLGCALIHKGVFEKMSYPWFSWVVYGNKSQLSEDLFFCEKFKELGSPIFVDTRVKCGHLMRHVDWPND